MLDSDGDPRTPAAEGAGSGSPGALRWLCWLPLASLLAAEIYVGEFDGWGAWAAAPILLLPALLSLVVAIPALLRCVAATRAGRPSFRPCLQTVIASLPLVWLGVRRFFM